MVGTFWYNFLAGTPFPPPKGALAPFFGEKGGTGPLFVTAAPLVRKKGVPAKLVIPTKIPTTQLNLILAKIPIPKKLLVIVWYTILGISNFGKHQMFTFYEKHNLASKSFLFNKETQVEIFSEYVLGKSKCDCWCSHF